MRSPDSVSTPGTHPFFHVARHAISAGALFAGSVIGAHNAFAQAPSNDPDDANGANDRDEIVVKGTRSIVNDKLGGSVHDAPQSINVISAKTLQDESVTRLQDALKNVPGITLNSGEGAARGDTVNLRGFPAFNDFFLDGIRDAAVYSRDSFDLETLEVLKGPSAILFGRGSTGGVINQVTKAPTLNQFEDATVLFGTNDAQRLTGDVNIPFAPAAAVRVNVMGEHSQVTDRDDVLNRRFGFAPSIAFGINEPDSVNISYLHQQENDRPDVGIPFLNGSPAPVNRNFDYGLLADHFKTSVDVWTLRARHEFTDDISVTNTARAGIYTFNGQFAAPNFGKTVPTAATPLNAILVGRDSPASSGTTQNFTDQTDFRANFTTGPISHTLTVGTEFGRETDDLARFNNPFNNNNNWIPETPLLAPNPREVFPVEPVASTQRTKADVEAGYLTDTIHIGDQWDVIGGVRYDRFVASFDQYTLATRATVSLGRSDNVTSPRAAIVYKFTPAASFYASYGTSFDPSAEALSLSTKTAGLGPVTAKSYEVGAKNDWLDGRLTTNAAVFRLEVSNAQTNDPDNPNVIILAGNQRVTGFEANVSGHITDDWEILAGYTYLDAKTISAGTPAYVGKFLLNTARNAVNLWTEYYVTDQWEIGTGGNFLGRRYADIANTASLPSYFVWNGMVSYEINEHYSLQMNVNNILDRTYYDASYFTSAAENHVLPGPGRTFTFTAHVHF
jgi:catecholate siderophore receptor